MVNNEGVKEKKSMIYKMQEFFSSIFSIFVKKQKGLPESSEETNEEFKKVKEIYQSLIADDSFENLERTYYYYTIGTNTSGKTVAIEKKTGYVEENPKFVARVRFMAIWRKSAIGNQDVKDEEACQKVCFSEESKKTYEEMREIIQRQLKVSGNIDTLEVLNSFKTCVNKWARSTSRRLFRNEIQAMIITDFFRSITLKPKKQTKKTLTTSQALYGVDEEF